jgi:hypothetical protein
MGLPGKQGHRELIRYGKAERGAASRTILGISWPSMPHIGLL